MMMRSRNNHPLLITSWQHVQKPKRSRNESCHLDTITSTLGSRKASTYYYHHYHPQQRQLASNVVQQRHRLYLSEGTSERSLQLHLGQTQMRHYGSRTIVELEEQTLRGMELMQPFLRSALNTNNDHHDPTNAEFVVTFLGTGGGSPTRHRIGSCTALRLGGQTFLFDVTEGTLRQLEFSRIMISSITKIFITHLHGDHIFGLVPVILGVTVSHKVAMSNPTKKAKHQGEHNRDLPILEIYGPPGLYNYITMVLSLSCSKVNYLNIQVIELVGGKNERGPPPRPSRAKGGGGAGGGMRNIFLSQYPEIEIPLITRKYLEHNEDKIWVIDEPAPISHETIASSKLPHTHSDGFHRLPNDFNLGIGRRLHIKAAEIDHLYGVQTFGYTVEEQPPPGNIDLNKAIALGVKPSKKFGLLKCGLPVPNDDGTDMVHPEQVLIKMYHPRKMALLADHRLVYNQMAQLCKGSDLLVHEATLSKADGLEKMKQRGHNTAYNAGVFAKAMGCKVVALNHFGSASSGKEYVSSMVTEACEGNRNASQIVATFDFLEISIPRGGFDFNNTATKEQIRGANDVGIVEQSEVGDMARDE